MAAAVVQSQPGEDDEAWLYGDESKSSGQENQIPVKADGSEKKDDREAGELSGEEESQEKDGDDDDDDDDDSDDDVQVTIGDIQIPTNDTPRNLFKSQGGYQKTTASGSKTQVPSTVPTKGVDVEAVGSINGVPTYDFDLDSLEDKPWKKPGADITDYFNYGFNEETWQQYCDKQKAMRALTGGATNRTFSVQSVGLGIKKETLAPPGTDAPQNVPVLSGRKPVPVAPRKMSGTIDVIGGTAGASRRPEGEPIQVAGVRKPFPSAVVPTNPQTGLPDYSIPPPGVPPPGLPPPGFPPPGLPPPAALGVPPPGYPPEFDPFYPPPGQPPSSRMEDHSSYKYETASHTSYTSAYTDNASSSFDRDRAESYWRDYVGRDRSPARSESELSSSGSERDYRYRESSSRRHDRDRDYSRRDRERERDRDRDSGRDRDRDRSRERTREHRHRDDKHKSRRKDRDEDSDHHRSKHKKSKRSKRDKDDDDPSATESSAKD